MVGKCTCRPTEGTILLTLIQADLLPIIEYISASSKCLPPYGLNLDLLLTMCGWTEAIACLPDEHVEGRGGGHYVVLSLLEGPLATVSWE